MKYRILSHESGGYVVQYWDKPSMWNLWQGKWGYICELWDSDYMVVRLFQSLEDAEECIKRRKEREDFEPVIVKEIA